MKKIFVFAFLASVLAFSGCYQQPVYQPGSQRGYGIWSGRTLDDVRYYNSDSKAVALAAERAFKQNGVFCTGHSAIRGGYIIYGRTTLDHLVTVDVIRRQNKKEGSEYTEVSVVYGGWGTSDSLEKSLAIIKSMSESLPREG